MYLISKLLKNPYKQHFIAESAKWTTKPFSKFITSIITPNSFTSLVTPVVVTIQCEIWKKSKDLLETLNTILLSEFSIKDGTPKYKKKQTKNTKKLYTKWTIKNHKIPKYYVEIPHALYKRFQIILQIYRIFCQSTVIFYRHHIHISSVMDEFFNRRLAFHWEQFMLSYLLAYIPSLAIYRGRIVSPCFDDFIQIASTPNNLQ